MPATAPTHPIDQTASGRVKNMVRGALLGLRRLDASRRALPDFLIIGAQKSGTTSLYSQLATHPDVAPVIRKETHFFTRQPPPPLNWYRAHFPVARPGRITGEATPYYLFHPEAPARAKALLPEVKLIAILRDPVDRAWSHFHFSVKRGFEPRPFAEAIEASLAFRAAVVAGEQQDRQLGSVSHLYHTYLERSLYAEQFERWLAHFDREQLLVIQAEPYFAGTGDQYDRVLDFLGLRRGELTPPHWRKRGGYKETMPPELRAKLIDFFKPDVRALREILQQEFTWDC